MNWYDNNYINNEYINNINNDYNNINNNYNNINNEYNNINNEYNNHNNHNNNNHNNIKKGDSDDIKEFVGYKRQNIINKNWKICNSCNLIHPLKFFIKSQKYCYNCWGWKCAYNFDLEYGKYITENTESVQLSEAMEILKTVLQFYDKVDNKEKITDSIFTKIIHYYDLGLLHNQFSKLIYKKKNLIFIGNKNIKIDYKNAVIYI
jgi:hypothetical protein